MVDRAGAEEIARRHVSGLSDDFVLVPEHTIEEPFGWVFFYQSRLFLDSGNFSDRLAGNGPLLVLRETGELKEFGTAHPLEAYLEPFRVDRI